MAIDTAALTDYSWADIAKAAKHAMITSAVGGSQLSINGRSIGRISIEEAKALYDFAQAQVTAETTDTGGLIALVEFGRPV